jgi:hypothetical protein
MSVKVYEIEINDWDKTGMWANSFVEEPANRMAWDFFGTQKPQYFTNDEENIVTGVAIRANQLVPRYDAKIGKYFVVFKPNTIKQIAQKFFESGNIHNVNANHKSNQVFNGVYLFESYIINRAKGLAPDKFTDAPDGSWVVSYKIKNDAVWAKVKNGTFMGLSIEGLFEHKKVNIKNNINMKNQKLSIREILFGTQKPQTFAQATTTEGVVVMWDGELVIGTALTVEVEGEMMPAPEGAHILTGEGVEGVVVTVDASGLITEIVQPTNDEPTEGIEEVVMAVVEQVKELGEQLQAQKNEFAKMVELNKELAAKVEKFANTPTVAPTKSKPVQLKNMHPIALKYMGK